MANAHWFSRLCPLFFNFRRAASERDRALGVWPASTCVKVDDTPVGIQEGRNAGCWTVGVTDTGNEVGLSLEEWAALGDAERETRRARAAETLLAAGADAVIPSVAELIPCLDEFEARLWQKERPLPFS